MFKKFWESAYTKAAVSFLISGGLLILFYDWIKNNQISVGFDRINKTLAPIYIGATFAFVLCPVYNACVRFLYSKMVDSASKRTVSVGTSIIREREGSRPVDKDERRRMLVGARVTATFVCIVLVLGITSLFIYFVVPQMVQNGINLANTLPERLVVLSDWLETHFRRFPQLAKWVNNIAHAGTNDIVKWIQEHILSGNAVSIASMVSSGVVTAVKYVGNVIIGLLIMAYLLNYKDRLFAIVRKFVAATCGQRRQDRLYEFAGIVNETFIGFIVGRIIDSFIIGVLMYIILKVFGIQFALMISAIIGVTNIIPFFGPFIGAVPSVLLLMLEDPMQALYLLIIIVIVQQLDGNVIGPKIVGNTVGISSFWVLIAVLIGGGLFGFYGMALGVPVFAVIYRYIDKMTIRSLRYKGKPIETDDYFNLESYGIDDDEISMHPKNKHEKSLFHKWRRERRPGGAARAGAKTEKGSEQRAKHSAEDFPSSDEESGE